MVPAGGAAAPAVAAAAGGVAEPAVAAPAVPGGGVSILVSTLVSVSTDFGFSVTVSTLVSVFTAPVFGSTVLVSVLVVVSSFFLPGCSAQPDMLTREAHRTT